MTDANATTLWRAGRVAEVENQLLFYSTYPGLTPGSAFTPCYHPRHNSGPVGEGTGRITGLSGSDAEAGREAADTTS